MWIDILGHLRGGIFAGLGGDSYLLAPLTPFPRLLFASSVSVISYLGNHYFLSSTNPDMNNQRP
jgi:hypothetical protein